METRGSSESSARKRKFSDTMQEDAVEDNDRISNLPEPVLHYMLSFLPTIYVVRTSVLSRRWRHLWYSMPYLDFDVILFPVGRGVRGSYQAFRRKFVDFVKWVLIFRDGSDIQRFRLSCFEHCNRKTVDRWMHVLSRRNVQELDISLHPQTSFGLPRCLLASESLKVLKLDLFYGLLELPTPIRFGRLTTLHLEKVKLTDDSLGRGFFSGCPFLEILSLQFCALDELNVLDISAVKLKDLTIENVKFNDCGGYLDDCDSADGLCNTILKISAPNLLYFKYSGPFACDYSLQNLSFIVDVFIYIRDFQCMSKEEGCCVANKMIRGFYNAKALTLSVVLLEYLFPVLDTPGCYLDQFYHLKFLRLTTGVTKCHIQLIIHLLKCCPNVETLVVYFIKILGYHSISTLVSSPLCCINFGIKAFMLHQSSYTPSSANKPDQCGIPVYDYVVRLDQINLYGMNTQPLVNLQPLEWEDYWVAQDEVFTCLMYHLKMVEIRGLSGGENELEFLKFLMKNGSVLQKMRITCFTDRENEMELIQKVLTFPIASSRVLVSFPEQ